MSRSSPCAKRRRKHSRRIRAGALPWSADLGAVGGRRHVKRSLVVEGRVGAGAWPRPNRGVLLGPTANCGRRRLVGPVRSPGTIFSTSFGAWRVTGLDQNGGRTSDPSECGARCTNWRWPGSGLISRCARSPWCTAGPRAPDQRWPSVMENCARGGAASEG